MPCDRRSAAGDPGIEWETNHILTCSYFLWISNNLLHHWIFLTVIVKDPRIRIWVIMLLFTAHYHKKLLRSLHVKHYYNHWKIRDSINSDILICDWVWLITLGIVTSVSIHMYSFDHELSRLNWGIVKMSFIILGIASYKYSMKQESFFFCLWTVW